MIRAFLLSLGLLLASMPGPGGFVACSQAVLPIRVSLPRTPLLHSDTPQGQRSPATREDMNVSNLEDKEEESDPTLVGCLASPGDRYSPTAHLDPLSISLAPRRGFLRRLHPSWRLLC